MKRIAIGAVTALSVWFGSALAAEAQQIVPTGPMAIATTDTSCVYTATINLNYSFTLYLTVTKDGTCVYGNQWQITNSGPSYNFTSPTLNPSTWNLSGGETINFRLIVQITPTYRIINNYPITVPIPHTKLTPSKTEFMMARAVTARRNEQVEELFYSKEGIVA